MARVECAYGSVADALSSRNNKQTYWTRSGEARQKEARRFEKDPRRQRTHEKATVVCNDQTTDEMMHCPPPPTMTRTQSSNGPNRSSSVGHTPGRQSVTDRRSAHISPLTRYVRFPLPSFGYPTCPASPVDNNDRSDASRTALRHEGTTIIEGPQGAFIPLNRVAMWSQFSNMLFDTFENDVASLCSQVERHSWIVFIH